MKKTISSRWPAKIKIIERAFICVLCVASMVLLVRDTMAQGKDDLSITLTAKKIVMKADGKESFEPADKAKPGEIIQYTAVYLNKSKGNIRNLEPTLPIPGGMEYVAGSAKPVPAKASTDGKIFEPMPLKRMVKSPDGTQREQAVPPSEYRALRWVVGDLAAGRSAVVIARARLTAAAGSSSIK